MALMLLPPPLLVESRVAWNLTGAQVSPGQTLAGTYSIVRFGAGPYWTAQLDLTLITFDELRCLRALRARISDGSPVVVPASDVLQPWPVIDGVAVTRYGDITFGDGALFNDGVGVAQDVIVAELAADAALNTVQMSIVFASASPLRGGERCAIEHDTLGQRLYEIGSVTLDGDGHSVVGIVPPLREDTAAGARVVFDAPACAMQMPDLSALDHALAAPHVAALTLKFVEWFPGAA